MRYGVEFNPALTFTDTISVSGNLGFTFSVAHQMEIGDLITIDKDNKQFNPQYDGTCSIVSVPNIYSVKTDKLFSTTLLAGESGYVTLQQRYTGTASTYYNWNGTRQYNQNDVNLTSVYTIGTSSISNPNSSAYADPSFGSTSKFLTSYNGTSKPVQFDDYETLSMILPTTPLTGYNLIVDTYSSGTKIGSYTQSISGSNTYRRQNIGVGPANLMNIVEFGKFVGGIYKEVDRYEVCIRNSAGIISEIKSYTIDTTCSRYEKVRLCFLNRQGGYDYFNFTLDSKKQVTISRTEYEKILAYNYSIGDRGTTTLAQKAEEKYTLNSNWITEKDSIWLEQLITSPDVFVLSSDVLYQNTNTISLTTAMYIFTVALPSNSTINIQFDIDSTDDLIIQDTSSTLAVVAQTGGSTRHFGTTVTMVGTQLSFYNILNYNASIKIKNLKITRVGVKLPIVISDTTYEVKTALRNQMFNLQLNYKYSYDLNLQNE
jgi:hypothetical protein